MKNLSFIHSVGLRSVFFYLTGRCNLRCRYCYFRHKGKNEVLNPRFADVVLGILKDHPDRGRIRFILSGGEPLLVWPLLERMVKSIRRYFGVNTIKVQTNAALLDARKLYFLKAQRVGLEIGIDGTFLSTGRHRLGISKPIFDRIGECIVYAHKLGLSVSTTMTVYPNESSALERNYLYLCSLGLRDIDITPAAFAAWTVSDTRLFKTAYSKLMDRFSGKSKMRVLASEDVPRRRLCWNLSVENNGVVLPGDVFLCLRPSVKKRLSLMRFNDGRLIDEPKNFRFFNERFAHLARLNEKKSFSPRDYVILSFAVLKEIVPRKKQAGCSLMTDLLNFLKDQHQKHVLK